jgi:hypothetical protein
MELGFHDCILTKSQTELKKPSDQDWKLRIQYDCLGEQRQAQMARRLQEVFL